MANKFTKFLTFTAAIGAATAAGVALYKKFKDDKSFIDDDFDDFDDLDDYDDDFGDLDSEDRGYTSITPESDSEDDAGLSDTLTEEEKAALAEASKDTEKEVSESDNTDI